MTNLSSYCGLVDAKIRAFDKDLPVLICFSNLRLNRGSLVIVNIIKQLYPLDYYYMDICLVNCLSDEASASTFKNNRKDQSDSVAKNCLLYLKLFLFCKTI